jgi:phospholipase C
MTLPDTKVLRRAAGAFLSAAFALANADAPAQAGASRLVPRPLPAPAVAHKRGGGPSAMFKHLILIIQENRTTDNLFNGFCVNATACADTVSVDPKSGTPLVPESLAAPFNPFHSHAQFVMQYDKGKMDGFPKSIVQCKKHANPCLYTVFSYVPANETKIYRQMATVDGLLSDATFETLQGPSFPAHYYAIAGQSGGYDEDESAIDGGSGTCSDARNKNATVPTLLMNTPFPGKKGEPKLPCEDFKTIFDLLTNAGHTWRYYANTKSKFFSPTQSIKHLYNSPYFVPSTTFYNDVANNQLPDVSFVVAPTAKDSDHPAEVPRAEDGPNWVASVVNAIGGTPYWGNSAIVIWWDDWGGFFDHVRPPQSPVNPDPFEYGFRVPLVVLSPYARVGTIDHTQRTFVSALRLVEETFALPSLGTTDQYEPDGLDSMFDFTQQPIPFTPLGGSQAQPFSRERLR